MDLQALRRPKLVMLDGDIVEQRLCSSRERMLAAMSGGTSDSVPVAPCYPNIYLRRFEWQAYLDRYRAGWEQFRVSRDLRRRQSDHLRKQVRVLQGLARAAGLDRRQPAGPARGAQAGSVVRARDGEFFLVDEQAIRKRAVRRARTARVPTSAASLPTWCAGCAGNGPS